MVSLNQVERAELLSLLTRRASGMTVRELAKKSGLSAPYITTIERNTSEPPPLTTCRAVARALGVSCEEMWQRSFAVRLKRWLKREGYSVMSDADLLDIVKKIESVSR
jgi:transcriptional regulator with XRE-family HTH domain